jgi:hypothetical protein
VRRLGEAGCLEKAEEVSYSTSTVPCIMNSTMNGSTTAAEVLWGMDDGAVVLDDGDSAVGGPVAGAPVDVKGGVVETIASSRFVAVGGHTLMMESVRNVSVSKHCCCCITRLERGKHMRPCGHRCCHLCQSLSKACLKCKTRSTTAASVSTQFSPPVPNHPAIMHTFSMKHELAAMSQANDAISQDVANGATSVEIVSSTASQATPAGQADDCVICMDVVVEPQRLTCGHVFCKACIEQHLLYQAKCPTCGRLLGAPRGNQPAGGSMTYYLSPADLPGYSGAGSIIIQYHMPSGIQRVSTVSLINNDAYLHKMVFHFMYKSMQEAFTTFSNCWND